MSIRRLCTELLYTVHISILGEDMRHEVGQLLHVHPPRGVVSLYTGTAGQCHKTTTKEIHAGQCHETTTKEVHAGQCHETC